LPAEPTVEPRQTLISENAPIFRRLLVMIDRWQIRNRSIVEIGP
jgi:hypothetical protein